MVARRAFQGCRVRARRGGTVRHVEVGGRPVLDEAGNFLGYRGTAVDVTATVEAKEQVALAQEKLAAAVETLSESFGLFDAQDRLVVANRAWREANGTIADQFRPDMTFEEILRRQIAAGLIPEAEGRAEEWLAERLERYRDPAGPFEVARQGERWFLVNDQKLPDGGTVSIASDITEIKRAERALRESEERFKDFALSAGDRLWETDAEHRFVFMSPLPGRPPPEAFLGRYRWDPPAAVSENESLDRIRADMVALRTFHDHRLRIQRDDGSFQRLGINGRPIFDESGGFLGYRGTTLDITAEVEAREQAALAHEKLAAAVETLSESFQLYDAEDRLVIANEAWRKMNRGVADQLGPGMTFEEIIRVQIGAGLIPDAVDRGEAWLAERVERHRNPAGPFEVARQDGLWLLINDQRLPDGGTVTLASDITAMKRTEEALRESEARFKDFAFAASDRLWETDTEHRFTYVSELLDGLPFEAVAGRYRWDPPGKLPGDEGWDRLRDDMIARRAFHGRRLLWRRGDGSLRHIEVGGKPVSDDAGNFRGYRGITVDVTAAVEAKEQVVLAQEKLAAAVEMLSESFRLFDAQDRLVVANKAWREANTAIADDLRPDMTFEEILRLQIDAGLMPDAEGRADEWFSERLEQHRNPAGPFEVARQEGRWQLGNDQKLPDGGTISFSSDITDLKRVEGALRRSEERLYSIIEHHRDAILIVDNDGAIRFANPASEGILGRKAADLVGGQFGIPLTDKDVIEVDIPGREVRAAEMQAVPLEWNEQGAFLVSLRDVTERKRAEANTQQLRAQLTHASRLSTLGGMAAGLAHEINQPLTAISSYVQACMRELETGKANIDGLLADMGKINRQVMRTADIVKWLRDLVKNEESREAELDLNACIGEVADYLGAEIRARKSELVLDLSDPLPRISADKVQVQQVLVNLIQNSLDAAGSDASPPHRISIRTSAFKDGFVRADIIDNGPGVPRDALADLFLPFYTTKADGLGFGLSISRSIIETHGGKIWVDPDTERGAAFAFSLPIAAAETS